MTRGSGHGQNEAVDQGLSSSSQAEQPSLVSEPLFT